MIILLTYLFLLISTNLVIAQTVDCTNEQNYVNTLQNNLNNVQSDLQAAQANLTTCQNNQATVVAVQEVQATSAYHNAVAAQAIQANPGTSMQVQGTLNNIGG